LWVRSRYGSIGGGRRVLDRTKRPGLSSGTMQRLRFRFGRGEELKYISHLDLMRLWSRALRRAGLPVAYSEGFSPHPKISLAAPLPIGVTSEAELMDITLWKPVSPHFAMKSLVPRLPRGIDLVAGRSSTASCTKSVSGHWVILHRSWCHEAVPRQKRV